jgi:hypothetical protein
MKKPELLQSLLTHTEKTSQAESRSHKRFSRKAPARMIAVILTTAAVCLSACGRTPGADPSSEGSTSASTAAEVSADRESSPASPEGPADEGPSSQVVTAQTLVQRILDQAPSIRSLEQETNVSMDMTMAVSDNSSDLKMDVVSIAEMTLDPLVMHMTSSTKMQTNTSAEAGESEDASQQTENGTSQSESDTPENGSAASPNGNDSSQNIEMESYMEIGKDGQTIFYSKLPTNESWTKSTFQFDADSTDPFSQDFLRSIESGKTAASVLPETEEAEGKTCYVMDTSLEGEYIADTLQTVSSTLSQMGMPADTFQEDLFEGLSVKMRYWIDTETGLPVKIEEDLTELGEALFNAMMKDIMSKAEESANGSSSSDTAGTAGSGSASADSAEMPPLAFTVHNYTGTIIMRNYNGVDEITIPEEVLNAKDAAEEAQTGQSGADLLTP